VPVALALALVAAQAVADHRAGTRADRLRGTPGVLAETITAPLEATPWGSADALLLLTTGAATPDGLVAGALSPGFDGPAAVVGLDPATGGEVWRVEVGLPSDGTGYTQTARCASGSGTAAVAETLWCTVTDAAWPPAGTSAGAAEDAAPALTTRLVEVDLVARAVAGARALEPGAETAVVGDVLVVGTRGDDGVLLRGSDVRGGAERWRTAIPDPVDENVSSGWLADVGAHVLVQGSGATWSVDPEDGRVEARAEALFTARGDALVDVPAGGGARLLGADGSGDVALGGYPLYLAPDDGSAPGIQPVSADEGSVVRGVDGATGAVRWERPARTGPRSGHLLLEGVLYGSDVDALWAVDAVTGDELWSVAAQPVEDARLMTDGRHLLRAERADESADLVLSAYDIGTGRRAWTTPLPEGVESLWPLDGPALFGYGGDGSQVVLLR
jgi:outer membrane protein assembly factor BamB